MNALKYVLTHWIALAHQRSEEIAGESGRAIPALVADLAGQPALANRYARAAETANPEDPSVPSASGDVEFALPISPFRLTVPLPPEGISRARSVARLQQPGNPEVPESPRAARMRKILDDDDRRISPPPPPAAKVAAPSPRRPWTMRNLPAPVPVSPTVKTGQLVWDPTFGRGIVVGREMTPAGEVIKVGFEVHGIKRVPVSG